MRVNVTGGNGFLGKHVCEALRSEGHDVFAPTSDEFDLVTPVDVEAFLDTPDVPDAVVHLAARVGGIGDNVQRPGEFLYDNAMMGLQLLEEARKRGISKFLTVGTACMYPDTVPVPTPETELWNGRPAHDTEAYAQAKRLLLSQSIAYSEQYDFNAMFVIPSNLYGPGDTSTHVLPHLVRKFYSAQEEGEDVMLWGSGSSTRDFMYVTDAAQGITQALEYWNRPDPINLGTGIETPVYALASAIAYEIGFEGDILWDPTRPEGTPRRALDCSKAAEFLSWTATVRLRQGLPAYLSWYEGMSNE